MSVRITGRHLASAPTKDGFHFKGDSMQYTEGRMGRVFVLRLEDGERLNDTLEAFARNHNLAHALAFYLGGSATGSTVVVGPDSERTDAVVPLLHMLQGSQEVLKGNLGLNAEGIFYHAKYLARCKAEKKVCDEECRKANLCGMKVNAR